jgi:hypothetical protein
VGLSQYDLKNQLCQALVTVPGDPLEEPERRAIAKLADLSKITNRQIIGPRKADEVAPRP